eukprot:scaffold267643_cov13-Tisochrysis_lutea.AAC.1
MAAPSRSARRDLARPAQGAPHPLDPGVAQRVLRGLTGRWLLLMPPGLLPLPLGLWAGTGQ